jgi:hypothetical protein
MNHTPRRRDKKLMGPEPSRLQSNVIITRLHRTLRDAYLAGYNTKRFHQARRMNGRTLAKALRDGIPKAARKKDETAPKTAA